MGQEGLYNERRKQTPDKRPLPLTLVVCVCLARGVFADKTVLPFVVAPEPVGSGARALGQSAFIAVADDATAASWNPAGLVNLERPEASFVGVWKNIANNIS
jgi:long-subunit fatty acid transport protein